MIAEKKVEKKKKGVISTMSKKPIEKKIKKRRWDTILIGTIMTIAFIVLLMRYSGYWPW
jgi:hypothetical protein